MFTTEFRIRHAQPSDAPVIAYHRQCLNVEIGFCTAEEYGPTREAFCLWVAGAIESERYLGLLAIHEDQIIGGVGAYFYDWFPTFRDPVGRYAYVTNVYVQPAFRRRGIARHLLTMLIAHCKTEHISMLRLLATTDGRPMYESLGFQLVDQDEPELRLLLKD